MKTSRVAALFGLFLAALNHPALACAACYNPAGNDKMTKAAAIGIFAMVVIMFLMMGAVVGFFWHLAWRAKHPLPDYQDLLAEDPTPGANNPDSPR
jgi:hypothetical protein